MENNYYIIDCADFETKAAVHTKIKSVLGSEDYIGNNLDALYDVLTSINQNICLSFINLSICREKLGQYCDMLVKVVLDAAHGNKNLQVTFAY